MEMNLSNQPIFNIFKKERNHKQKLNQNNDSLKIKKKKNIQRNKSHIVKHFE